MRAAFLVGFGFAICTVMVAFVCFIDVNTIAICASDLNLAGANTGYPFPRPPLARPSSMTASVGHIQQSVLLG